MPTRGSVEVAERKRCLEKTKFPVLGDVWWTERGCAGYLVRAGLLGEAGKEWYFGLS